MSSIQNDPALLQDFLTESGELLEQLDRHLVALEHTPDDPDLINCVFRALHTIKGSASFLALTQLVKIAHAAESALNAARARTVRIDRPMMDLLLAAVDTLRRQFDDLNASRPLTPPDQPLVDALARIGGSDAALTPGAPPASAAAAIPAAAAAESALNAAQSAAAALADLAPAASAPAQVPLVLPESKRDLLEFFATDLRDSLRQLAMHLTPPAANSAPAPAAALPAHELTDSLQRCVEFFEFPTLTLLTRSLALLVDRLFAEFSPRIADATASVVEAMAAHADALSRGMSLAYAHTDVLHNAAAALEDAPANHSPTSVLTHAAPNNTQVPATDHAAAPPDAAHPAPTADPASSTNSPTFASPASQPAHAGEQTIRVEVARLETLLNLVGELVLQKNRIGALSRSLVSAADADPATREHFTLAAGNLERVTSDIQVAVMRTRMQPLDKLFGRYPRLIRDLARKTGKNIDLIIEGAETEVDKSVIEELADPLIHLLRNAADHGVETPEQRLAAGKTPNAVIRMTAANSGGHVRVTIADDGRGLDRQRIAHKIVERGLATRAAVDAMPDQEVYQFIFAAGFSTADQVSDLSGRGVGMDVVRSNVQKIKGSIDLATVPGRGTTFTISIPLTVAIMSAMMVCVADEIFAVPIGNILEIVKVEPHQATTINSRPVLRLRDSVLPLIHAPSFLGVPDPDSVESPFAVVLASHEKHAGLLVSRLVGQQEIVVKPLDAMTEKSNCVSGATVRDDGGVSLIVDVAELINAAESHFRRSARPANSLRTAA